MRAAFPVVVLLVFFSGGVRAEDARVTFLLKQLERSSDARLRAQAAVMLAATGSPAAIEPLCRASAEADAVVRAAAVKGLTRLSGSRPRKCLEARAKDSDADVRAIVASALRTGVQPASGKRPDLYVSLGPVEDRSGKKEGSLSTLAARELRNTLAARGALLAPESESQQQARKVLSQKKLQGFYLMSNVDPTPSGGIKLTLVCFTYPERTLLGEVNVKAAGAPADHLIRALVARAVEDAAETFEWGESP